MRESLSASEQEELDRQFMAAAMEGDIFHVKSMADQGANVETAGEQGRTALGWAACGWGAAGSAAEFFVSFKDTILFLLSRKANPHHQDAAGATPLHLILANEASGNEDWEEAAIALAKATSIPDLRNNIGETPLVLAVHTGAAAIVRAVAATGVEINQKTQGFPLFHFPAILGRFDIVETLLTLGADPNARPDSSAASKLIAETAWLADSTPLADPTLFLVARKNNWDLVRLFIGKGADTMVRDGAGRSLEDYARDAGRADIVDFLRKKHARAFARATKKSLRALPRPKIGK